MNPIIKALNENNQYDIITFTLSRMTETKYSSKSYTLTGSFLDMRNMIAREKCDIIFYPDIGMHNVIYFLAHARLAPVQCVFPGHPVTTGIKNIDYYFSQKDYATDTAQEHYSEKLIRFNHFPAIYNKPAIPDKLLSKAALNLDDSKHYYLVPSKLQKMHPDFDTILAGIASKDEKAQFLFFLDNTGNQWDVFIQERLLKSIDKTQLKFLPWANPETFYSLLEHADAVLEPYGFGFGTTAIEAFSIGTPIVTLPSEFVPGRVSYAIYQQMNFKDLIASNVEEYISIAIKLATDKIFYTACKDEILMKNNVLYNNEGIINELEAFIQNVVK